MNSLGKFQASIASATSETTLALANLNFDFSLIKVEPPAEYREVGKNLAQRRRDAAESGSHHSTARKLGSLFQSILPPTPKLIQVYGRRVSDISSSSEANPKGTTDHGAFKDFVGIDGTTIWAAATSGPAAVAVHLLATLLATMWPAPEACAIWEELVLERKRTLTSSVRDASFYSIEDFAATRLTVSRDQLAEWDSGARAWLLAAQRSPYVRSRHTKLMLILKNINLPISNRPSVYDSVISVWQLALETMEKIANGGSYSVNDGAVLLALSAWNLYPDLVVIGREEQLVQQCDYLIPTGVQITIGLDENKGAATTGVRWSLSLKYLRYYGAPVDAKRSIGSSIDRWDFNEFMLVLLGALLGYWNLARDDLEEGMTFIQHIVRIMRQYNKKDKYVSALYDCLKEFDAAIVRYRKDAKITATESSKLVHLGWRNSARMLGQTNIDLNVEESRLPGLLGLMNRPDDLVHFLRSRNFAHVSDLGDRFAFRLDHFDQHQAMGEKVYFSVGAGGGQEKNEYKIIGLSKVTELLNHDILVLRQHNLQHWEEITGSLRLETMPITTKRPVELAVSRVSASQQARNLRPESSIPLMESTAQHVQSSPFEASLNSAKIAKELSSSPGQIPNANIPQNLTDRPELGPYSMKSVQEQTGKFDVDKVSYSRLARQFV